MIGKKLKEITIIPDATTQTIAVTFSPDVGPNDHYIFPRSIADAFIDKLTEAYEKLDQPSTPGDKVAVSDYSAVAIVGGTNETSH